MTQRPNLEDYAALPKDHVPGSDPALTPRAPKPPKVDADVQPKTPSNKPKVTPLDEDENIKDGIQVNET